MFCNVSVDELHERWLSEMSDFAKQHLAARFGKKRCYGHILSYVSDDEYVFRCEGTIKLPPGSGDIFDKYALFSRATMLKPKDIIDAEFKDFPAQTYCLHSLLVAAYPKNVDTGIFKSNDCAIAVGDLPDPKAQFRTGFCAFGGLGVILMNECRSFLCPLAPDKEIIQAVDGAFLSIIE